MTRLALGWWLAFSLVAVAAASAAEPHEPHESQAPVATLKDLMALLAGSGGVRARFVETRHLSLLSEPLESEGRLYFEPPDRLARVTTRPSQTRMVIRGERLSLRDDRPGGRLDLGGLAMARELVDNVKVVLGGDLATLRRRYDVSFGAGPDGWRLRLEPRASALRRFVEAIELAGRAAALERMEVRESSGDRTVTRFLEVETGVVFSEAESERLFALDTAR